MSANAADVLKILVVGDVHLGFSEKDAIRGMDSFDTLEEV
jgi:DNA repair exonuclease SbcCD nuclease subunit